MCRAFICTFACLAMISTGLRSQDLLSDSIDCHFTDASFTELVHQLENEYGLQFYFKKEWIENVRISVSGRVAIHELLDQSLVPYAMGYVYRPANRVLIIPGTAFVREFPEVFLKVSDPSEVEEETGGSGADQYLRGRHMDELCILSVGKKNGQGSGRKCSVTGYLFDDEDRTPLVGATIYIRELEFGAVTDDHGRLGLNLRPGEYSAVFRCMGMAEVKCVLQVLSDGTFEYYLQRDRQQLEAVTVVGEHYAQRIEVEVGLEKLDMKQIKEMPSFMGEKDPVKIAQLLPGVVSVSEAASGINVRGGNADQNMFYLNNMVLYNTSHAFGFFSAINAGLIRDFSIHKGYVPARYGGRLSSIFLIESRRGSKDKLFAQGGISPISANLVLEAPLVKQKLSVVLSGRASFSDWITKRLPQENLKNSSVAFNDFALSGYWSINEKNDASLSLYNSNDQYSLNKLNEVSYSNLGTELVWEHRFHPGLMSKQTLSYSRYSSGSSDMSYPFAAYTHAYTLNHTALNSIFHWRLSSRHRLNFGGELISYLLDRGEVLPLGNDSERTARDLGTDRGMEGALFLEDGWRLSDKFTLSAGIRYSFFLKYGPDEVHRYAEDQAPSSGSVVDTKTYDGNEMVVSYGRPGLRLALDYRMKTGNSLKLVYTELSQYIFSLSNSYALAPSDQWKLCDTYIKPGVSRQVSAAFEQALPRKGIQFSFEAYLKRIQNILEFRDGADFLETANIETEVLQGRQEAWGIEFMVSRERGRVQGWLSYAYSQSIISVDGVHPWEQINDGLPYPSNYDKPHVLNLVGNYRFNKRFVFSANVVYSSGRPITLPMTSYYMNSIRYVEYSRRNEFRLDDYFRLDLSLSMEGNLKKKKPFHSFWMLNIYNATGRENPYSVYFSSVEGQLKGFKYSIIGVPVVTISWNFKLGNYNNG